MQNLQPPRCLAVSSEVLGVVVWRFCYCSRGGGGSGKFCRRFHGIRCVCVICPTGQYSARRNTSVHRHNCASQNTHPRLSFPQMYGRAELSTSPANPRSQFLFSSCGVYFNSHFDEVKDKFTCRPLCGGRRSRAQGPSPSRILQETPVVSSNPCTYGGSRKMKLANQRGMTHSSLGGCKLLSKSFLSPVRLLVLS